MQKVSVETGSLPGVYYDGRFLDYYDQNLIELRSASSDETAYRGNFLTPSRIIGFLRCPACARSREKPTSEAIALGDKVHEYICQNPEQRDGPIGIDGGERMLSSYYMMIENLRLRNQVVYSEKIYRADLKGDQLYFEYQDKVGPYVAPGVRVVSKLDRLVEQDKTPIEIFDIKTGKCYPEQHLIQLLCEVMGVMRKGFGAPRISVLSLSQRTRTEFISKNTQKSLEHFWKLLKYVNMMWVGGWRKPEADHSPHANNVGDVIKYGTKGERDNLYVPKVPDFKTRRGKEIVYIEDCLEMARSERKKLMDTFETRVTRY